MAKNKYGIILNIASDLSLIAPDNRIYNSNNKISLVKPVSYSVVKHGITGLTDTWPHIGQEIMLDVMQCSRRVFNNQQRIFK